jgi:hypothetical protein
VLDRRPAVREAVQQGRDEALVFVPQATLVGDEDDPRHPHPLSGEAEPAVPGPRELRQVLGDHQELRPARHREEMVGALGEAEVALQELPRGPEVGVLRAGDDQHGARGTLGRS